MRIRDKGVDVYSLCVRSCDQGLEYNLHMFFDRGRISMVLWSIRRDRNCKIWRNNITSPKVSVFGAIEVLFDWLNARNTASNSIIAAGLNQSGHTYMELTT